VQLENTYLFNQPLEVACIVEELVEVHKIFKDEVLMALNNLLLTLAN
jgi:hypothetical protein